VLAALAGSTAGSHFEGGMMDASLERLARNQTLFREVNERLLEMSDGRGEGIEFLCECSQPECSETIPLSLDEYNEVRSHPKSFVIVPGHETPEVERVTESNGHYIVVEKLNGARFAVETDPRTAETRA
jgi:hypothetical protein